MKQLIQFIKSWQLKQAFIIFLAGSLLVLSTACSQGKVARVGSEVKSQLSDTYDKYDANQAPQGGINVYNDDPRYGDSQVQAKAKALVDGAKTRTNQYDFEEYPERIGNKTKETFEQAREEIPQTLQSQKDKAVKDIQNRTNTLRNNLEEAQDNFSNAVDDASQSTQETARNIKNNLKDLT